MIQQGRKYTDKPGTQPVSMLLLTEVGPLLMVRQFVKLDQVLKLWHLSQGNNSFLYFFFKHKETIRSAWCLLGVTF